MESKRNKALEIVTILSNGGYKTKTENSERILELKNMFPYTQSIEAVFYNPDHLTAEEIVDKAMAYKPIMLGPEYQDPKIRRSRAIEIVTRLKNCSHSTEEDEGREIEELELLVPDPCVLDLIFHTEEMTAEEIVDKAMSYQPIILGHD